jgi:filamentous hemagglutinin family protein
VKTQVWIQIVWVPTLGRVAAASLCGAVNILLGHNCVAQVVPDLTLPVGERSQVSGDLGIKIDGGATRGSNLFHSFQQFSIPTGGSAVFNNSNRVNNIITRITGNNRSDIDGLIRANGTANLFLINPSGIIFGPNARLEVGGSFLASTANSLKFADGSEFNAKAPQASPLLTISVPIGLQTESIPAGSLITNRGHLTAGQDLVLVADRLDLQGQLMAGRDLVLQAQDMLKVRDTALNPFVARSGRNLTLQGNRGVDILALAHPAQPAFVSGGNLSLLSDGVISGDAHFSSGGDLRIQSLSGQRANFTSLYDPIISSAGNVDIAANYSGAALLIEAQGGVRVQGTVTIDAPDTVSSFVGEDAILRSQPGLIVRSGQPHLVYGGVSSLGFANSTVPAGISLASPVVVQPNAQGAVVRLTAADGPIVFHSINAASSSGGTGGTIALRAKGDIRNTGAFEDPLEGPVTLGTFSNSETGNGGNGGNIALISESGNIVLSDAAVNSDSFSPNGNSAAGGSIFLSAAGNIELKKLPLDSSSYSLTQNAGNGGAVTFKVGGQLSTDTYVLSRTAGGGSGNGGNIDVTADTLNFTQGGHLSAGVGRRGKGNGGSVNVNVRGAAIFDGVTVFPNSFRSSGIFTESNGGRSGDINVRSESLAVTNGGKLINSNIGSGNAGDITIDVINSVLVSGLYKKGKSTTPQDDGSSTSGIFSVKKNGGGNAGNIIITAGSLAVTDGAVLGVSLFDAGNAGNIRIKVRGDVTFDGIGKSDLSNPIPLTSGAFSTVTSSATGNGGNISIIANSSSVTNGAELNSNTAGGGNAGSILLTSPTLNINSGGKILAATESIGKGGTITINAPIGVKLGTRNQDISPVISVETSGAGQPGDIVVNTPTLTLSNTARITATATATATNSQGGGSITLNASNMDLAGIVGVFAETQGQSPAGTLRLNSYNNQPDLDIKLTPNSQISASTSGRGKGGDLIVSAPRSITIAGPGRLAVETSGIGDAGNMSFTTQRLTLKDGVKISASTTPSSTGKGGNITIAAPSTLIQDGASVAVDSRGTGIGGNIDLQADQVTLNRKGAITAETASTQGGNIRLDVKDLILLRQNSLISATAGTAQAGGDGGNITLNSNFIVAIAKENSDIRANAFTGTGGTVRITTQGIFGIEPRSGTTAFSDITASSDFGVSGTITLNRPDVDPSRGTTPLPTGLVDTNALIANSCIARRNRQGRFVITGTGGLATQPDDLPSAAFPTYELIPEVPQAAGPAEPDRIYQLATGEIILGRSCR